MARYIAEGDVYALFPQTGIERIHVSQIDELPRADVAPKSEVAREIFEEIQKMVNRYWLDNDYGMPDMETELTKLKKKYTEDQT
jgi:aspartate oxidase